MSPQKSSSPTSDPPTLDLRLPPSPPQSPKRRPSPNVSPINHILTHLHLLRAGKLPHSASSPTFRLSPADFLLLTQQIDSDPALASFYHNKVAYDYSSALALYTLRMPSAVHEVFTARVVDAISAAISALADRLGGAAADALKGITKGGSPTLKLLGPPPPGSSQESNTVEEVETHRCPDGTFFHRDAPKWPGVVVEVSYSQRGEKLGRIAEGYVVDSLGGIRCVVGLHLPYKQRQDLRGRNCDLGVDQSASLSIWRPRVEKDEDGEEALCCVQDVDNVPFQGQDLGGKLELTLADLLPPTVLEKLDLDLHHESICIPFSQLAKFYLEASNANAALEEQDISPPHRGIKKRKRKRTPEEELDEERVEKFRKMEEAEDRRERREDRAWRGARTGSGVREPERRSARLSLRASRSVVKEDEPS